MEYTLFAPLITNLEDVGEISQVEDVVELDGCRQEGSGHLCVHGDGGVDQRAANLLHWLREFVLLKMLQQDVAVDRVQSVDAGEAHGEHAEVALQTTVDGEAAGRRVHARHVLRVVHLFQGQLCAVVPMAVVEVLADECVGLYGEVLVDL